MVEEGSAERERERGGDDEYLCRAGDETAQGRKTTKERGESL